MSTVRKNKNLKFTRNKDEVDKDTAYYRVDLDELLEKFGNSPDVVGTGRQKVREVFFAKKIGENSEPRLENGVLIVPLEPFETVKMGDRFFRINPNQHLGNYLDNPVASIISDATEIPINPEGIIESFKEEVENLFGSKGDMNQVKDIDAYVQQWKQSKRVDIDTMEATCRSKCDPNEIFPTVGVSMLSPDAREGANVIRAHEKYKDFHQKLKNFVDKHGNKRDKLSEEAKEDLALLENEREALALLTKKIDGELMERAIEFSPETWLPRGSQPPSYGEVLKNSFQLPSYGEVLHNPSQYPSTSEPPLYKTKQSLADALPTQDKPLRHITKEELEQFKKEIEARVYTPEELAESKNRRNEINDGRKARNIPEGWQESGRDPVSFGEDFQASSLTNRKNGPSFFCGDAKAPSFEPQKESTTFRDKLEAARKNIKQTIDSGRSNW